MSSMRLSQSAAPAGSCCGHPAESHTSHGLCLADQCDCGLHDVLLAAASLVLTGRGVAEATATEITNGAVLQANLAAPVPDGVPDLVEPGALLAGGHGRGESGENDGGFGEVLDHG